jgi:hypothetical protein
LRRRMAVLALSAAVSSFGFVAVPAGPAQACAEIDPAIGCIGPCARPLQGSPTCPTPTGDGNGKGERP